MEIQLSDWAENIVGKGEIAHYKQFLLFPHCFQKLHILFWSWLNKFSEVMDL